ncbi:hypothetical protein Tco_0123115 [Tanacetum coccineum]
MKRPTKGYSGQEVALFPTMLNVPEPSTSPLRITSSPSHSPKPSPSPEPSFEHTPDHTTASVTQPSPTQTSPTQPSPRAEHHLPTPNESPLHVVQSHRSDEGRLKLNELTDLVTKLSDRIGVLEAELKKTKQSYSFAFTKLIFRVKKLENQIKTGKARRKSRIVYSDDEDIADDSSKQGRKLSDAEVQAKASNETEPVIQDETPTKVIRDQESSEKGQSKVSTAEATQGTASEVLIVSIAEVNISTAGGTITYRRRSEEKRTRKDKGKAIMTEPEPKKKSKKELEQERLSLAEAIRLQEQIDEAQRAQIARDEEIARQWEEEERQRVMSEAKSSKKIDWNDPSVIRETTRLVTSRECLIMRLGQHIEPMDLEHGSERMKSPEKIEEEDVDTQEEMKEVVKESGAKRKKFLPRKRRIVKRQKLEEDAEKEELKGYKNYKVLSEMLEEFDRQDVEELYRLVKERYSASRPEGYDLMLWGDLHTLFEPDGRSYNEIRPIFEKVWDFNQHIEPMEHGSEKMKSLEKIEEKDADTQKEMKEVVKESGAKRKKSLPADSKRNIPLSQEMIIKDALNKRWRLIMRKYTWHLLNYSTSSSRSPKWDSGNGRDMMDLECTGGMYEVEDHGGIREDSWSLFGGYCRKFDALMGTLILEEIAAISEAIKVKLGRVDMESTEFVRRWTGEETEGDYGCRMEEWFIVFKVHGLLDALSRGWELTVSYMSFVVGLMWRRAGGFGTGVVMRVVDGCQGGGRQRNERRGRRLGAEMASCVWTGGRERLFSNESRSIQVVSNYPHFDTSIVTPWKAWRGESWGVGMCCSAPDDGWVGCVGDGNDTAAKVVLYDLCLAKSVCLRDAGRLNVVAPCIKGKHYSSDVSSSTCIERLLEYAVHVSMLGGKPMLLVLYASHIESWYSCKLRRQIASHSCAKEKFLLSISVKSTLGPPISPSNAIGVMHRIAVDAVILH